MVVLIGGSSHVGKTMIAHKLIEKHGWECISLDCLKSNTFYIEKDGKYDEESLFDAVESVIEDNEYMEKGSIL